MKFSLIIATLNRKEELNECVNAILMQSNTDFEIIIVDQSEEATLKKEFIDNQKIIYLQINEKGLSHARNIGIERARGEYICLIDDDGIPEIDYLNKVTNCIENEHPIIIGCQIIDPVTQEKKGPDKRKKVTYKDAFSYFCSPGMVIEANFQRSHLYDEMFGVGAKYGSGEETDVVLAALSSGYFVLYDSRIHISHPVGFSKENKSIERVSKYAYGYGALCKKTVRQYSEFWGRYFIIKTVIGN